MSDPITAVLHEQIAILIDEAEKEIEALFGPGAPDYTIAPSLEGAAPRGERSKAMMKFATWAQAAGEVMAEAQRGEAAATLDVTGEDTTPGPLLRAAYERRLTLLRAEAQRPVEPDDD